MFVVNNCEYFAPLSSPKPKHLKMKSFIDFVKIQNGELGAVNFNNMIPVTKANYNIIDLDNDPYIKNDIKYQNMLKKQFKWITKNFHQVEKKAFKLYNLYINNKLDLNIKNRCCNFKLLEEKCIEYKEKSKV